MSLAELKEVLSGPCRRHPVRSLRVFGSVAHGEASQGSDLDLLVQFEDMLPAEYATHYFGLLHAPLIFSPECFTDWQLVLPPEYHALGRTSVFARWEYTEALASIWNATSTV